MVCAVCSHSVNPGEAVGFCVCVRRRWDVGGPQEEEVGVVVVCSGVWSGWS